MIFLGLDCFARKKDDQSYMIIGEKNMARSHFPYQIRHRPDYR